MPGQGQGLGAAVDAAEAAVGRGAARRGAAAAAVVQVGARLAGAVGRRQMLSVFNARSRRHNAGGVALQQQLEGQALTGQRRHVISTAKAHR